MRSALKGNIVGALREDGFKGSFPTFRRVFKNSHQVLNFQFNKYGGSFAVNLHIVEASDSFFETPYTELNLVASRRLGTLDKHLKNKRNQDNWFIFVEGLFFMKEVYDKAVLAFLDCYKNEAVETFEFMRMHEK